jgi:hypothetical protein
LFLPNQSLCFVDDLKQLFQGRVVSLRVLSAQTDLGQLLRVRRKLKPSWSAAWVDDIRMTTDDQVRIKACYLLSESAQSGNRHLDAGAMHADRARHKFPIGTVFILEG